MTTSEPELLIEDADETVSLGRLLEVAILAGIKVGACEETVAMTRNVYEAMQANADTETMAKIIYDFTLEELPKRREHPVFRITVHNTFDQCICYSQQSTPETAMASAQAFYRDGAPIVRINGALVEKARQDDAE